MSHADYQSLVDRLADAEPHSGYTHAGRLELTDADVATVLADAVNGDDARGARAAAGRIPQEVPAMNSTQKWAVGQQVKVGSRTLIVVAKDQGAYILMGIAKNGAIREYRFTPPSGLERIN